MLLLATDLDGTFLGGGQDDRAALYRALREEPDAILAFVTGRAVETIMPLLSDPLIPAPDFIVADVGSTLMHGDGVTAVQPLQHEIDIRWVSTEPILDALSGLGGLERQPVPQVRRCSFLLDDPSLLPEIAERLAHLECELLFSAGRFLDVLPRGVSKGSTLRWLVDHLGIADEKVLVAGDTLNDLSLYEQGFRGVVVGRAEKALIRETASMPGVYQAKAPGAGGIIEAIRALSYSLVIPEHAEDPETGDARLVIVYHRLPFEERVQQGKRVRQEHRSPNGIIPTLLGLFEEGRHGSWLAWSIHEPGDPDFVAVEPVDCDRYPHLNVTKIPLRAEDVERFYKQFSKEAFWPVIFSFADKASFSRSDWDHFLEVNRLFAEAAAVEANDGAAVFIHDYNHWMVPAFLRQLRPDVRIGFFHHTSFPPVEVFNVIPWADQIVGSLAQCDYVGFHIPRYAANFVSALQSHRPAEILETQPCAPRFRIHGCALSLDEMPLRVRTGDRTLLLGADPVGVNAAVIRDIVSSPQASEHLRTIRDCFAGVKMVLSVERLDYVKGPIQKLEAFESFLKHHPEWHGKVVLVFVATPPAPGMDIYLETQEAVDQIVGRINGHYRTLDWAPIHYLYRSLPFEDVIMYDAVADVAWITPLRDGLNLVTKEYVVAQNAVGGAGVLVISEFAGAAVELHGAIFTNPYDIESLEQDLFRALTLPEEERRQRMRRLGRLVESHDVSEWGRTVLQSIMDSDGV